MGAARRIRGMMPGMVRDLQELVRQPSVSATGEGLEDCAGMVCRMLAGMGANAKLLRIKGAPPVVYGEVISEQNPSRTLLFYNHYDVQPVEPVELWDDDPYSGRKRRGRVYGRGASDDKGELVARLGAVRAMLDGGGVPCNVKFVIEGEEEVGSPHVREYLLKHRKKFACDGVVWEFGYVDVNGRPIVGLGMKGLLFVELTARGPARDMHSSLAAIVENPAWRLVRALHTLRDARGRVLVRDWYVGAERLSRRDIALVRKEPFDARSFKSEYGVKSFLGNMGVQEAKRALVSAGTCNIAGLSSGYGGEGAKTVLPSMATAKLDFRLVPGMVPSVQAARLRRHLCEKGYGDIGVKILHGEAASRTDPSSRLVQDTLAAAIEIGRPILNVSNAATGPMDAFASVLGVPCVSVGCTHVYSRIHSPNEHVRLDLLERAARCMCGIAEKYAAP